MRSSWVSRIWATSRSNQENAPDQRPIKRDCPAAAAACNVGKSVGRVSSFNGERPRAMAPDDTTTTSLPARVRAMTSAAKWAKGSRSVLLSNADPIFTTTRRADTNRARAGCRVSGSESGDGWSAFMPHGARVDDDSTMGSRQLSSAGPS